MFDYVYKFSARRKNDSRFCRAQASDKLTHGIIGCNSPQEIDTFMSNIIVQFIFLLQADDRDGGVNIELFRVYVFDAKHKSFLVPILSRDWLALAGHAPGHLSWCLWNSHTLKPRATTVNNFNGVTYSRMLCCTADHCVVDSVFTASDSSALLANDLLNNHEVGVMLACYLHFSDLQLKHIFERPSSTASCGDRML